MAAKEIIFDVDAKNNYGWTALMSASNNGQTAVCELLLPKMTREQIDYKNSVCECDAAVMCGIVFFLSIFFSLFF